MATEYRPCVVAVFTNLSGQVLVCERSDVKGAWQFPQGGIDPGESALNAVYREMREELGCDSFRILKEAPGLIKYKFPDNLKSSIAKKWLGQSQVWFLAKFDENCGPDLKLGDNEFINFKWESAQFALDSIVEFKKESYRQGLVGLGLIND